MYDPRESMGNCLFKNDSKLKNLEHCPSNKEITRDYLDNLKVKGPKNLELPNMNHVSKSIIKFFLLNDRQFQISDSLQLSIVLKELKRLNLLSRQSIIKICGFQVDNNKRVSSYKWDYLKFKKYLNP